MSKKIDGLKLAVEMLQGLDTASQQSLIAEIARRDPDMAIRLKQNMVSFDDLKYISVPMLKRLLVEISLDDLGMALRGASRETVDHLLGMFSTNMKRDIDETLKGKPRPLSEVMDAQKRILNVVLRLKESGELDLSKN